MTGSLKHYNLFGNFHDIEKFNIYSFHKSSKELNKLYELNTRIMKSATDLKIGEILANQSDASFLESDIEVEECPWKVPPPCDPNAEFRTFDGSCNNLKEPNWGRTLTTYQRMVPAEYAPGTLDMPRISRGDFPIKNKYRFLHYQVLLQML